MDVTKFIQFFSVLIPTVLVFMLTQCILTNGQEAEFRRPFFNIAHMVNSIPEIEFYLDRGANAIEADITFLNNGVAQFVYHGSPCDCLRRCQMKEDFGKYLDHVRTIATPGHKNYRKQLVLLFLDLKVSKLPSGAKYTAGQSLAEKLTTHLWDNGTKDALSNIYVLLSIGHTTDMDVVKGVRNTLVNKFPAELLQKQIGWDIGLNDKIRAIDQSWSKLGMESNVWLGDGITNCLSYFSDNKRLKEAIKERDLNSRVGKVYRWTVDFSFSLKYTLRLGVDGIITNHPERLKSLIETDTEFNEKFKMATNEDSPWDTINSLGKFTKTNSPTLEAVVSTVGEAVGSFWKYVKERTGI